MKVPSTNITLDSNCIPVITTCTTNMLNTTSYEVNHSFTVFMFFTSIVCKEKKTNRTTQVVTLCLCLLAEERQKHEHGYARKKRFLLSTLCRHDAHRTNESYKSLSAEINGKVVKGKWIWWQMPCIRENYFLLSNSLSPCHCFLQCSHRYLLCCTPYVI